MSRTCKLLSIFLVALLALSVVSCSKKPREASGIMDSPEHHYEVGVRLLDKGEVEKAGQEFDLALQLDDEFGPALAGKGFVTIKTGGDVDDGFKLIERGQRYGKSDEQKLEAVIMEIRACVAAYHRGELNKDKMVFRAEKAFGKGERYDKESLALHYFMGEAYLQALEFEDAEEMFAAVKESTRKEGAGVRYVEKADERWELLQKAKRAAPGSIVGKRIVLVDEITRADMSGLLVQELNVARFYERTQKYQPSKFEAPSQGQFNLADMTPEDVKSHPLRTDIETVLEYGVQGLSRMSDTTFQPDDELSKAEIAMIFEDIIIRATGDDKLGTKFIGQQSPFSDVRGDHAYFNAVMLTTTRGILEADKRTGLFKPSDSVSGVDALLYIKELKMALNPF